MSACSVNSILGGSPDTAVATNGAIIYQEEVTVYIQVHIVCIVGNCLAEGSSNTALYHISQRVHLCSGELIACLVRLFVCLSVLTAAMSVIGHCDTGSHRCDEQWRNF